MDPQHVEDFSEIQGTLYNIRLSNPVLQKFDIFGTTPRLVPPKHLTPDSSVQLLLCSQHLWLQISQQHPIPILTFSQLFNQINNNFVFKKLRLLSVCPEVPETLTSWGVLFIVHPGKIVIFQCMVQKAPKWPHSTGYLLSAQRYKKTSAGRIVSHD